MATSLAATIALMPTLAQAQSQVGELNGRPIIVAAGTSQVSRPPDYVRFSVNLQAQGQTATQALQALQRMRATLEVGMRGITDVAKLDIAADQVNTQDVRSPKCQESPPYLNSHTSDTGDCAAIGVSASLTFNVKVAPASRAGDLASVAGQLGGRNVEMGDSGIDDEAVLMTQATEAAVVDARREAQVLARAAGVRLGQLLRVQDAATEPDPFAPPPAVSVHEERFRLYEDAAPAKPLAVPMAFNPKPVIRSARVTLIYAIEP